MPIATADLLDVLIILGIICALIFIVGGVGRWRA
jgi:hypothetical protein